VADAIRPLPVVKALVQLSSMPKHAGEVLKGIVDSAVANAKQKNAKGPETLAFKSILVTEGPSMKRWHAVSKGSAHAFKKRMTHITVILTDTEKEGN